MKFIYIDLVGTGRDLSVRDVENKLVFYEEKKVE